uniref:HipA N-terminal domain-containing protein n=1 Tax=Halomonas sp. TaxID=1486246 RepID=UPI00260CA5C0|nr:HipA N-terminal domain-containing protein [Halomonas sp.]
MANDSALKVYHGDEYVGRLYDTQPLRFEYATEWLEHPEAVSLSPSLTLSQRVHVGEGVLAYFENLLLEGDQIRTRRWPQSDVLSRTPAAGRHTAKDLQRLIGNNDAMPRTSLFSIPTKALGWHSSTT